MATRYCILHVHGTPVSVHRFRLPLRAQENGYTHGRMYQTFENVMRSLVAKMGCVSAVPKYGLMLEPHEYSHELFGHVAQYLHTDLHDVFRSIGYSYIKRRFW